MTLPFLSAEDERRRHRALRNGALGVHLFPQISEKVGHGWIVDKSSFVSQAQLSSLV